MRIISIILALIFCFALCSCTAMTSEEIIEVEATIIDADYDPMRTMTQIINGQSYTTVYPADYDIIVQYEDVVCEWNVGSIVYHEYEQKIGETIKCNLIIRTYDDGTVKKELKVIEE